MPDKMNLDILVSLKQVKLAGCLAIPPKAKALVVFAHGSGSSRFSPRNQFVANYLQKNGLATLLIDLLTKEEEKIDEETRSLRFDIDWLAQRLLEITKWTLHEKQTNNLPVGYFGSSTGAGAALEAAALSSHPIFAVVSRGGRPDLAKHFLPRVKAPTLLIVGGNDLEVVELNQQALKSLSCEKKLEVVPRASHLFEEPGCLEKVANLASGWFLHHQPEKKTQ